METAIIVALITFVGTLLALLFSRRGTKEANKQTERANQLREREIDWERRGDIIADLNKETERLRLIKRATQQSCGAAQAVSIDTIHLLHDALHDEVAREMAKFAIENAKQHQETHDPDQEENHQ